MQGSAQKLPSRPLKVLHLLVSLPVGGAEDLVAAIVRGLSPERFAAGVACLGFPGPVGRELQAAGFPVSHLGLDVKRTSFLRLVTEVRRLLQELRPDLLHTHLYHPNLYGRLAALGLGIPVVAAVHNSYTRVKFHRRLWNSLLGRITSRVLVGSAQVLDDVRRYDCVPASRLLLLPYGIRLEELETPLSRSEAREILGVSGFVLGAVGRLEEQKGHLDLLEALARARQDLPETTTLLLVGDGRLRPDLERRAAELGLAAQVRFLGTRRDLPLIYRALDLFVQPSRWEGLPLALLKAMGTGLPVLATRVSGVREVIQDGLNGRLVEPADAVALARVLVELYRQPEVRASLGTAARLTIRQDYSLEAMLGQLERLYLELGRKSADKFS